MMQFFVNRHRIIAHGNFLSKQTMNRSKDQQRDQDNPNQEGSGIACSGCSFIVLMFIWHGQDLFVVI